MTRSTTKELPLSFWYFVVCVLRMLSGNSVLQRHHKLIATAEGRHMLKSAVRLHHQLDWTIAEHRMTAFRHVPCTALTRMGCHRRLDRLPRRRRELRTWQGQCQE